MLNKTLLQLFLLMTIIVISILFFKFYFIEKKTANISKKIETIDKKEILDEKNLILFII